MPGLPYSRLHATLVVPPEPLEVRRGGVTVPAVVAQYACTLRLDGGGVVDKAGGVIVLRDPYDISIEDNTYIE